MELVGNTPLVQLQHLPREEGVFCEIRTLSSPPLLTLSGHMQQLTGFLYVMMSGSGQV
jgi:hypothetical protein